jgi:hypothetical protein
MSSPKLIRSIREYRFLIDRGYNPESALRLVENRYVLSRLERDILYRGVHTKRHDEKVKVAFIRGMRELEQGGPNILIDFINVVTTIIEIIDRSVISIGSDGLLRDHAKVLGRSKKTTEEIRNACRLIGKALPDKRLVLVSEKNYPYSELKAGECARVIGANAYYIVVDKVDSYLIKASIEEKIIVATSDSVIIEKAPLIMDLPYMVARDRLSLNENVVDIEDIIYGLENQFY